MAGGSNNAASTTHVAHKACMEALARIAGAAVKASDSPFHGADPAVLVMREGVLQGPGGRAEPLQKAIGRLGAKVEVYAENVPTGLPPEAMAGLYKGLPMMARGSGRKDFTTYAFGAQFVEGPGARAYAGGPRPAHRFGVAAGNIINPLTAYSQLMGGAIWGLSSALHEGTELDLANAAYINKNLADYLVPVKRRYAFGGDRPWSPSTTRASIRSA